MEPKYFGVSRIGLRACPCSRSKESTTGPPAQKHTFFLIQRSIPLIVFLQYPQHNESQEPGQQHHQHKTVHDAEPLVGTGRSLSDRRTSMGRRDTTSESASTGGGPAKQVRTPGEVRVLLDYSSQQWSAFPGRPRSLYLLRRK